MGRFKKFAVAASIIAGLTLLCLVYVRTNPLVFNESFWEHAHCAPQVGLALRNYAHDHDGAYPTHKNGYGDALLLLFPDYIGVNPDLLTGPGYTGNVFSEAYTNKTHIPESECGRVYVQGLRDDSDPNLVVLFDKLPNPGDHNGGPRRIWSPLRREVVFADGSFRSILEKEWPAFASNQVELLIKAGFPRAAAEACYNEKPKPR